MDLNTLTANLRAQAGAKSTIVLDDNVFVDAAVRAGIRSAFALSSGDLTIKGVKASDIPDPGTGGVLEISAGTTSVLKQSDVRVHLTFTSHDGDGFQATIVTEMGSSWEFKKSFEGLDTYPFNLLETSGARFVYTTVKQPQYSWPEDASETIALERGLNFLSNVTFKHFPTIKSLLEPVIKDWDLSFKLHGPLTPIDGQPLPVGKIRAKLGSGEFKVGVGDNALKLQTPAIAVKIDAPAEDDPSQRIELAVEANFNNLEVAVGIPLAGVGFEVSTTPLLPHSSIEAVIRTLPGGAKFSECIPSELESAFSNVGLENFALFVSLGPTPKVTYLGLSVTTLQPWEIISDFLTLQKLRLEIQTLDPTGRNWTRAFVTSSTKFLKEVFKDEDFDFTVELEKQDAWEVKSVNGSYYGAVSLGDIAAKVLPHPEWVPSVLNNLVFSDFGVHVYREAKGKPFSYKFSGSVETSLSILDTKVGAVLHLTAVKTESGHDVGLRGGLGIGEQTFPFQLDLGQRNATLRASWENKGTPLGFGDIARAFGWDEMPELPQGFDLGLDKAELIYDFKARKVALSAHSVNYGQVFFASTGNGAYVFSVDIPFNLKFSEAPVLGDNLHIDPPVGIDELQIIVTSKAFAEEDVKNLNIQTLIPKSLAEGLTIAAKLQMGGTREIVLPLTGGAKKDDTLLLAGDTTPAGGLAPVATSDAAPYQADPKWFELKKTFGPVYFDKIGVQYQNAKLRFLLNAALSAAGLTLSVDGLSVGSSLTKFEPNFDLRGLGIDYKGGGVQIGGAFLRTVKPGGTGKPDTYTYDGAAVIKTKQFTLSAIGSYTKLEEQPSLFIYAFLNYPLGGPSFFFVTGLAAGFGYNRRLIAPSIEKVAEFPLIKQALGKVPEPKDVTAALTTLRNDIPPDLGSIFLAVGVRFNSFKLIDSFALLTIEFGNDLAINLLGLSKAVVPTPETGKTVTPLAQVEIAWKASFNPKDGCLGIDARLTPNSYILSKDCRLTGGYAFYSWFSGPHAGDFVQTLGGYHPRFVVPDHYPKVPRLAFDWRVSDALTIQGDAYYALTGSALMAGGHLEVLYRRGELRAWLKVGADFLIAWKPYHYDASLYVNVGASYTFDIDLLFGHIRTTISVDVGAQLHLWGPDFSGTAKIDLSVISFTIAFGAGASQTPAPIGLLSSFQESFLPAKEAVCSISVKDGLVRKIEAGGKDRWIINPKDFALVVDSAMPFKSAPPPIDGGKDLTDGATVDFGIRPMAVSAADLKSKLTVTIRRGRDREVVNRDFDYSAIKKQVPAGLWGKDASLELGGKVFLENVPSGVRVTPRKQTARREIAIIDLSVFKFSDTPYTRGADRTAFAWDTVGAFKPSQDLNPKARRDEIKKGVERNPARASLLDALGVKVAVNIGKQIVDQFVSAPQIGKNL
jgi:hypothetical protein